MVDDGNWLFVEGGGTRTWMRMVSLAAASEPVTGPSTNPYTVGWTAARSRLAEMLAAAVATHHPDRIGAAVVAHGAATTQDAAEEFGTLLVSILREQNILGPVIVTGDMAPLLFSATGQACVAVIAGTGSEYAGRSPTGEFAIAGGLDYLLSDEGSGFDIGLQGLRAVVRALDGRGPATSLLPRAQQWAGATGISTLRTAMFDALAHDSPRTQVASFARDVLELAGHDDVSRRIAEAGVNEIFTGIRAVAGRIGYPPRTQAPVRFALTGSIITQDTVVRRQLLTLIQHNYPAADVWDYTVASLDSVMPVLASHLIQEAGRQQLLDVHYPVASLG